MFDAAKPLMGPRAVGGQEDSAALHCDPSGPPQLLILPNPWEIVQIPGRTFMFFEEYHIWRTVWTDGRPLPQDPDPSWLGYSVGHWEGDYTFVVNTLGSDERTWLDNAGHPHSIDLRVEERYTRVNHNQLEVTVKIDDPKTYTEPFVITKSSFTWIPEQDFEEELCVPSEQAEYLKLIADPAANNKNGK